ncbi:hypothetical protein KIN20_003049 [Parelaphostrongylus tenuis]|uniref:Uncharacterized protein n=1 Tax=Parelaphostrongylus tenuis TaxID=148309 RepID=A0AAD5M0R1_PARTN|nr:hypothetical protein KIN20_003049 [Parelaphostrongylus tenuis]
MDEILLRDWQKESTDGAMRIRTLTKRIAKFPYLSYSPGDAETRTHSQFLQNTRI